EVVRDDVDGGGAGIGQRVSCGRRVVVVALAHDDVIAVCGEGARDGGADPRATACHDDDATPGRVRRHTRAPALSRLASSSSPSARKRVTWSRTWSAQGVKGALTTACSMIPRCTSASFTIEKKAAENDAWST